MSASRRIAMWVWYRGDRFRGFQRQVEGPTVQDALLTALAEEGVGALAPSGRTDLGVHARMQVVSIRARTERPLESLAERVRPRLPEGLGLCAAVRAPDGFHAQFSASGKEYRYRLRLDGTAGPWTGLSWNVSEHPRLGGRRVTPERLAEVLRAYEGTHDFIAFHEKASPRKPRTIHAAQVVELGDGVVEVRLTGSGFARYQVRYMVGSAAGVASGALDEGAWREAIATGSVIEGVKAPAHGLTLWDVRYPDALEPFGAALRAEAPTLPCEPPFQ